MIVCSMLLLVYWLARAWVLIRQPEDVVNQVLDSDLGWFPQGGSR